MTRAALVREGVRTLHPGYFALVMATGIVSIAMRNQHAYLLSVVLLGWPASNTPCSRCSPCGAWPATGPHWPGT